MDYTCTNGTILNWDYDNSTLTSDNYSINDTCLLSFESRPRLYDLVNLGDYISYTGNNGCSGDQCSGWNASQTAIDTYENFGYCKDENYKYIVYGWRVLHKTDNSVYIVSAGAPECRTGTASNSTTTKNNVNTVALKYCNASYASGGLCDATTAYGFNGDDFYKFNTQYYGSENARYLYDWNDGGTYGTPYCSAQTSNEYCGYNNDIIDNGGHYWFGSRASSVYTLAWYPASRKVSYTESAVSYGVRPVIKLDASILATGGGGTMTNPYTISTIS